MAMGAIIGAGITAAATTGAGMLQSAEQAAASKDVQEEQTQMLEEQATTRQMYSEMVQADVQAARDQLNTAEQVKLNLTSLMGQPGTYGPTTGGPISLGVLRPTGVGGLGIRAGAGSAGPLTGRRVTVSGEPIGSEWALNRQAEFTGARPWEKTYDVMDPAAMTEQIAGTAGFRAVSQMVAEAEQLVRRSGPAWESLNQTMVGSIYEGAAQAQRETAAQISQLMARKGGAGRAGWAAAQAMMSQERINRDRSNQLWQARAQLEEFRMKYPPQVLDYSQAWINNQAGIRDAYTANLMQLQLHWSTTMAPVLVGAASQLTAVGMEQSTKVGEGLMTAANTKGQAISGAIEGLVGAVKTAVGEYANQQAGGGGSTPTAAGGNWTLNGQPMAAGGGS
jgi:hypothetical protein